jgi:hypothetical protein
MPLMRFALVALAILLAACGRTTTVRAGHRPVTMDLATTEWPVSLDLVPADATRVVPTQRASRDYRRPAVSVSKRLSDTGSAGTALAKQQGRGRSLRLRSRVLPVFGGFLLAMAFVTASRWP